MVARRSRFVAAMSIGFAMLLCSRPGDGAVNQPTSQPAVEPLKFRMHTINAESKFEAAGALDANHDGKFDIYCGGFWYEAPMWKKHVVRELTEQDEYYRDFCNQPYDVDGDGWTDIIDASWHGQDVFWVRNPGETDKPWEVVKVDEPGSIETAVLVDINGDGRPDVLPNISGVAAWYEFHTDPTAERKVRWKKHELPAEIAGHGVGAGDINGDGRCDVVGFKGWAEQPAQADGKWTTHLEFDLALASIPILVYDVDGDGDNDLIYGLGHAYGLYWLEQDRNALGGRTWCKHEIDVSWSQAHYLLLADLDNDKQLELLTGKRYRGHNDHDPGVTDPKVIYYYKLDRQRRIWTRYPVAEGGPAGFGISTQAVDMDNDGDLDIIAPGKSGLYLFENLTKE